MGLDENLPNFHLRQSKDVKHDSTVFLSQYGSDAMPTYTVRHPDPASAEARNRYAAALYDSYNPEILYGEVLLIPEWNQPTLSQEEIRKNGGVPPPPQPILPNQFVVQLYNPDQQIVVRNHPSTWNSAQYWDFEMPSQTFRQPSVSTLDRSQDDPTISEATPQVEFKWKRDGKLSKDLICNLSGRRNPTKGRKHKEPDIPMAFFRHLTEMTLYEPNLNRIDLEDPKGFEVVLLLSAAVIKDVYFTNIREAFNINEASRNRAASVPKHPRAASDPSTAPSQVAPRLTPPNIQAPSRSQRPSLSLQTPANSNVFPSRPPPTDPRSQWEIDAETVRLRQEVEGEKREAERRRQEQQRREKESLAQVRKIVEQEEREARKRQAAVDKETERLRREYEAEQRRKGIRPPTLPPRHSAPPSQPQQQASGYLAPYGSGNNGPYLQAPNQANASSSAFFGSGSSEQSGRLKPKRSSFFGLRGGGDESSRLLKKQSAIF